MTKTKEIKMRELQGDDLFTVIDIVAKLDIEDKLAEIFDEGVESAAKDFKDKKPTKKELEESIAKNRSKMAKSMMGLLQHVMANIKTVKVKINELLADLTGLSLEEIRTMPLVPYGLLVKELFQKEELKDFFTSITSSQE